MFRVWGGGCLWWINQGGSAHASSRHQWKNGNYYRLTSHKNHTESESEELRIVECLRYSSCELVTTSSGSIRASMPAAATVSVGTAAAPGPATTCLPASSHQLQPSVRQSSHSKWEMWAYTLDFGTFFLEFFEMKTFWFDVEVLWQIVFVVAGKRKEVIDFFFEKGDMTFDRDLSRRRRGCNLPVQCQWWAHIFVQHQYPVSIGEH